MGTSLGLHSGTTQLKSHTETSVAVGLRMGQPLCLSTPTGGSCLSQRNWARIQLSGADQSAGASLLDRVARTPSGVSMARWWDIPSTTRCAVERSPVEYAPSNLVMESPSPIVDETEAFTASSTRFSINRYWCMGHWGLDTSQSYNCQYLSQVRTHTLLIRRPS